MTITETEGNEMKKLVRNKIPQFATDADYRKLDLEEIEPALKDKIVEEALEVQAATTEKNLIEELGDVYTVLTAFLKFKKIDQKTFLAAVEAKRKEKGDFSDFLLMETEDNDD